MYEFSLDTDVEDLEAEEARQALAEFTEKHEQNVEEYNELKAEFDDLEAEKEDLEEKVAAFNEADEELAEEVAEATFMEKEEALGLDFSRKREILAEAGEDVDPEDSEFTEESGDEGGDETGPEGENTTELGGVEFTEDETERVRDEARDRLQSKNFL